MTARARSRLRLVLAALLIVLALGALVVRTQYLPLAEELGCILVDNKVSGLINEAIHEQMLEDGIDYDSLIRLDKDANGHVSAMKTDMNEANRIRTEVLQRVDEKIEDFSLEKLGVPMGSILLPQLFSGYGPLLPIRVLAVTSSDAQFENDFSAEGINQTLHRISVRVRLDVSVSTPNGTTELTVETTVLVAQTVIVGTVPNTYITMNGEGT